jgi:hypothetical protein
LFHTSTTGSISVGGAQTTGALFLGTTPTGRSGPVVIGATGCNTESRGPMQITSSKLTVNGGIDTTGLISAAELVVGITGGFAKIDNYSNNNQIFIVFLIFKIKLLFYKLRKYDKSGYKN